MRAGPSVVVRPRRPADVDAFIALFEEVAAEGKWIGSEVPLSEERKAQMRASTLSPPERTATFVADGEGEIVGFVGLELDRAGRVELGMLVSERWRRRGVGSLLLEQAISWAKSEGAYKITLEVWPHNTGAIRLYEKFGFVVEGRFRRHRKRRNGELWDSIPMGLVLDESAPGSPY